LLGCEALVYRLRVSAADASLARSSSSRSSSTPLKRLLVSMEGAGGLLAACYTPALRVSCAISAFSLSRTPLCSCSAWSLYRRACLSSISLASGVSLSSRLRPAVAVSAGASSSCPLSVRGESASDGIGCRCSDSVVDGTRRSARVARMVTVSSRATGIILVGRYSGIEQSEL
jgi:hypothetical protein